MAAFPPSQHHKVAQRPPTTKPQAHISVDIVHLDGKDLLHVVDECPSWSEAKFLSWRDMDTQILTLKHMQHLRHGPPKTIRCDRAYEN